MGHLRVSSSSCFKARTSAIDMKMSFNSHVNKSCFYKKDFALSLVLNVRVIGTQKRPIHPKMKLIGCDISHEKKKEALTSQQLTALTFLQDTNIFDIK